MPDEPTPTVDPRDAIVDVQKLSPTEREELARALARMLHELEKQQPASSPWRSYRR